MKKALNIIVGFALIIIGMLMILVSKEMFEMKIWALLMVVGAYKVIFADDKEVSNEK